MRGGSCVYFVWQCPFMDAQGLCMRTCMCVCARVCACLGGGDWENVIEAYF